MNIDYLKEALKLETEKLKIFAAYFAGLFAVMGNIIIKDELNTLFTVLLFFIAMIMFLVGVALGNCLIKCYSFLNLLKKQTS